MKIACGIVLYKPSDSNIKHLMKLICEFDVAYVFKNSNDNNIEDDDRIIVFKTGKNEGLAKPYNVFLNQCRKDGVDILCLLDQDTKMNGTDIEYIKKYIKANMSSDVAIYAPALKGEKLDGWTINSNSFLNVKLLRKYKIEYDENYFIDRLDADFCKQLKKKKLKIKIIENIEISHPIGDGSKKEHSALRHYYIFRNRLYYNRKNHVFIISVILNFIQIIKHIFIIIFEKDSLSKLHMCLIGGADYVKNKYGRISR